MKKLIRRIKGRLKREVGKLREYKTEIYRSLKQKKYNVISFKEWCELNNLPIKTIDTIRSVTITQPVLHSATHVEPPFQTLQAELPEVYLASLKNATVLDGCDMVIGDDKTVLYDEMAHDPEGRYAPRLNLVRSIVTRDSNPSRVGILYKKSKNDLASKSAIHFCKDYSGNYFHWLIEALPRLAIVEKFPELDSVPLLVDNNLLPQQLESLSLINNDKREIIQLKLGEAYHIENLYYPSGLSQLHNNYKYPVAYGKDIVISPYAIEYLRKKLLPLVGKGVAHRNIYISRKNSGASKRLLNDDEISLYMAQKGFEIVHPENMTFFEQIKLFSEAKIIMGAGGAAFANMVFAPKGCRVFALNANNRRINYSLFCMMAEFMEMKCTYILGQDVSSHRESQSHNDYTIDTKIIESVLNS